MKLNGVVEMIKRWEKMIENMILLEYRFNLNLNETCEESGFLSNFLYPQPFSKCIKMWNPKKGRKKTV